MLKSKETRKFFFPPSLNLANGNSEKKVLIVTRLRREAER